MISYPWIIFGIEVSSRLFCRAEWRLDNGGNWWWNMLKENVFILWLNWDLTTFYGNIFIMGNISCKVTQVEYHNGWRNSFEIGAGDDTLFISTVLFGVLWSVHDAWFQFRNRNRLRNYSTLVWNQTDSLNDWFQFRFWFQVKVESFRIRFRFRNVHHCNIHVFCPPPPMK